MTTVGKLVPALPTMGIGAMNSLNSNAQQHPTYDSAAQTGYSFHQGAQSASISQNAATSVDHQHFLRNAVDGLQISHAQDGDSKRRQQAECARALQDDAVQHTALDNKTQFGARANESEHYNSSNMWTGSMEDGDSERRKQEQYSVDLRQQQEQFRKNLTFEKNGSRSVWPAY
jgi:hypothetical protein